MTADRVSFLWSLVITALCVSGAVWCYRKAAAFDAAESVNDREAQANADYDRELAEWASSLDSQPVRLNEGQARKVMHRIFPENPLYWPSPSKATEVRADSDGQAVEELLRAVRAGR